jgi:hypothetical protein
LKIPVAIGVPDPYVFAMIGQIGCPAEGLGVRFPFIGQAAAIKMTNKNQRTKSTS